MGGRHFAQALVDYNADMHLLQQPTMFLQCSCLVIRLLDVKCELIKDSS